MYRPGQILFQKDFYFQIVNQKVIEEVSNLTQKLYEEFYKQNKLLVTIYSFIFIFLIVDLISLLITLSSNGVFKKKSEDSSYWELILPIFIEWFITIGFYINFKIRKKKLKSKVKQIIDERKKLFKCYNSERSERIIEILKLQGRHFKNSYFEKLLETILLVFIPIIIKSIIFRKIAFKVMFSISSTLFYGYDIIFELIKMIIRLKKQIIYNKELYTNKNDNCYNSINNAESNNNNQENNVQDNNLTLEDIDININDNYIFERNKKLKSYISENYFNISFLVIKSFMGILFIIYFTRIGEKLDDKANSTTWIMLFIPCYISFLPILLFCIFHSLSLYSIFKGKIWIPIITLIPCYFVFVANCVIIPLKLDNKINFHESFITIFFVIGTIFLIIHITILNKYKKSNI